MIFKKVNIMDELAVLEQSQRILDDRLKQEQIDPEVYAKKYKKLTERIKDLKEKQFAEENYHN